MLIGREGNFQFSFNSSCNDGCCGKFLQQKLEVWHFMIAFGVFLDILVQTSQVLLVSTLYIICLNSGCLVKKQPRISNISYSKGHVQRVSCYWLRFSFFSRIFSKSFQRQINSIPSHGRIESHKIGHNLKPGFRSNQSCNMIENLN